ncbi:MAG TPA: hypothetical protein VI757_12695, partial [Bacteroidia bacterium]|nr:hypothetical protein [Bacteroidia bacterium]
MKPFLLFTTALICTTSIALWFYPAKNPSPAGDAMTAQGRADYEFQRLAGPDGKIPEHIREKELAFSATLPNDAAIRALNPDARGAMQ